MDDSKAQREAFSDANAKANELLFRRVDLEDAARAHERALHTADEIQFKKYIISAPTPFTRDDLEALRRDPAAVVSAYYPGFARIYEMVGFRMFEEIDRVYVSHAAGTGLGWEPRHDFGSVLAQLERGEPIGSDLAQTIGSKGYHSTIYADGPYPID